MKKPRKQVILVVPVVFLLEAGGSDDLPEIHTPAAAPTLFHTAVDWDYFTEEEPHLHNRKLHWPRGKVLGGSSSINYTIYVRGHRHDYNRWQELGNTGWSYDDVLPYFKKAEDQERGASAYHGVGGPLHVMDLHHVSPRSLAFVEAGVELGWLRNDDCNGASQEGFGPAEHLRTCDIPVVVDLPGVGYHLQDHPCIYISYKIDQPGSLYTGGEGNAYIKSRPELPEPDMQMLFTPSLLSGEQGYTLNAVLATPQSHGHLELRSTDPTQYPAIFANYLENENDLQRLIESVKLARRLASTKAFAPFGGVEVEPGPQVQSDQEIVAFIRKRQSTMFHPVGTCKMGRDEMAVVDEELRVHGVHGLRVIDASIIPTIVNGNTNAPAIMIAEKGADLISGNIH